MKFLYFIFYLFATYFCTQDLNEIKKALCPFPGYHGLFCPSSPSPSFLYSRQLQSGSTALPSGVGISLDVTTGSLKFPVLSFSEETQTWKDPASGISFLVPPEIILSPIGTVETPNARVFRNEFDLTAVWANAVEQGQWLGGEFGEAKGLNSVFQKFFKEGTSTAITQQTTTLYSLKTSSKKLNKFAQYAIDSLPKDYSSEYNDFLDNWGTHIAVETQLGGMKEQQTIFKDCVWTSPFFTNGLSQAEIESILRNEILDVHTDFAYFAARRKISLDHKFGGSPDANPGVWQSTLAQNPALLKIMKFQAWNEFVEDPAKAANLAKAIAFRVAFSKQNRDIEYEKIKQQRQQELMAPRPAKGVAGYGSKGGVARNFQIGGQITLSGTEDCPTGLNIAESMSECNTGITVKAFFPLSVLFPENPRPGEQELDLSLR